MERIELIGYGHTVCGAHWGMERETAAFCRVYYVLGGACTYRDETGEYRLKRGTLYFLPQYRPYTLTQNVSDPFRVLWQHICASHRVVRNLCGVAIPEEGAPRSILLAMEELTRDMLVETVPDGATPLVEQITRLLEALISVLEEARGPVFHGFDERLARAWACFGAEGLAGLSVSAMAEAANMERSYFSRVFTRQLGMPPQRFLTMTRINEAARLLLSGATVEEAGAAVGYTDGKAFSRAFSAQTHCTPSRYRKSHILQP